MKPQLVISASKDGSVRLWNIETGICILIFAGTGGHRSEVLSVDFHASDMSRFVSCDMEATTKIWSLTESWKYVEMSFTWKDDPKTFPTQVYNSLYLQLQIVQITKLNRWYGCEGDACDIRLWQPQLKENSPGEGDFYVRLVYAIPDSYHRIIKFSCDLSMKFVSVGNDKGDIYVWDLKSFPPVLVTVLSHYKSKSLIRQTAMSTDGTTILATSEDGTLWRWDVWRGLEEEMCGLLFRST
ncbi:hypothetical protein HID58_092446 [Brassica napus]|uniref:Uncharacterized protein n=1 Tax=Brassica napus TaxID=3708 RepID=A0ABQ7WWG8_BRANA|nr:hypothetical protein HID58_092446 [Brassica napus]